MNTIFRQSLLIFGLIGILLTGCVKDNKEDGADLRVGDPLPNFSATLSDGSTVSTATLAGKVSVIMFFTVSCPDCQAQFPAVEDVYAFLNGNPDVVMFGISRAQGEATVSQYWQEQGLELPYSAQSDRYLYSLFARAGVPRIYVADKQGIIRTVFTDHPIATYRDLREAIESLMVQQF